ncbi:hypothetical protein PsorP6_008510 [Peronosclerospora sorghi]|uniref:Uncharacterized protein n=1 Tax=Peronosclerospora sorghi TaxID=230839 RepID=A0ACC0W9B7_9STRA|nr:hypothetical protein PsorP6_008510 [Peronosclerospora sorghi]
MLPWFAGAQVLILISVAQKDRMQERHTADKMLACETSLWHPLVYVNLSGPAEIMWWFRTFLAGFVCGDYSYCSPSYDQMKSMQIKCPAYALENRQKPTHLAVSSAHELRIWMWIRVIASVVHTTR